MSYEFDALDWTWLRAKRGTKWARVGGTGIPAWVADMDFPVCPPIRDAILAVIERGDLGYPAWESEPLAEEFCRRMTSRYDWAPEPSHVRGITELVQGLQVIITLATVPGDAVTTVTPNYPPFLTTIPEMDRRLTTFSLEHDGSDWRFNPAELHRVVRESNTKLLVLVNPHNPTGHVFTRHELESVAEIAERQNLIVVSDEIHADLTYDPFIHIPFASISAEAASRTVTITSATKAFNIAGLRCAVAHIGSSEVRDAWDAQPSDLLGSVNILGVEATLAAWRDGDPWLAALRMHLRGQRDYLMSRLSDLAGVTSNAPDATYLAWLDCRSSAIFNDPAAFFRAEAGVELMRGDAFGLDGRGFTRLNFATSRPVLASALDAMAAALEAVTPPV